MTQARTDLLPFARVATFGLPFHGKIINGKMTLSNGTQITYSQPANGAMTVIKAPGAVAPVFTEKQAEQLTAAGKAYKTHAYLSGSTHKIGGQAIGADRWLYCDGNRTWQMKYVRNRTDPDESNWRFEIWVEKLFGVFSDEEYAAVNRLIYSYDLKESPVIGEHEWLLNYEPTVFWDKTGAKMLVNFRDSFTLGGCAGFEYLTNVSRAVGGVCPYRELYEVVLLTLSGTGSTNRATLGQGISCSEQMIWVIAGYPSYDYSEYGEEPETGTVPHSAEACELNMAYGVIPVENPCKYDGAYSDSADYVWGWTYQGTWLYFLTSDGSAKAITFSYSSDFTFGYSYTCTACEEISESDPNFKSCHAETYYDSYYDTATYNHSVYYDGVLVIAYDAAVQSTTGSSSYSATECGATLSLDASSSIQDLDGWWRFAQSGYFGGAWSGPDGQYLVVKTTSNDSPDVSIKSLEDGDTLAAEVDDYYVYDFEGGTWFTAKTLVGYA